jgi:hypothetical protein
MLLSLPILQGARVNTLLLQHNKPALFIQLSANILAGAVKLFLSFLSQLSNHFLQYSFAELMNKRVYGCSFSHSPYCASLSVFQKNKRRDVV